MLRGWRSSLEVRHAGPVTPLAGDVPRMRQERGWGEGSTRVRSLGSEGRGGAHSHIPCRYSVLHGGLNPRAGLTPPG